MAVAEDENQEYVEMVMSSSAFITKEFLEEVLSPTLGDLEVTNVTVAPAVGAGENYCSILYKTAVEFTTGENEDVNTLNIMIKGQPVGKNILDFISDLEFFNKEINMYNACLPAMHRILREYFPEGSHYVGPDSYPCNRENTLVMEDLQVSGYGNSDRRQQLDFAHAAAVFRNLARFHALSVKLNEIDPETVQKVTKEVYAPENKQTVSPYLEQCLPLLASIVVGWEGREKYSEDLSEIGKFIWEKLLAVVAPTDGFNVVVHGDLWSNNILFRHDEEGEVESTKFVDFQMCRFTSPAIDLLHLFFTSLQPDVLVNQMFELTEVYHEALTNDLAVLGVEVEFSLEELLQSMRDHAVYAFVVIGQVLPVSVAPGAGLNFEGAREESDEDPFAFNYKQPLYEEVCGQYLEHLESIGYMQDAKTTMQEVVEKAQAEEEAAHLIEERKARFNSAKRFRQKSKIESMIWTIFSSPPDD